MTDLQAGIETKRSDQSQRHANEMASLYEMGVALTSDGALGDVLGTVLKQVKQVLECDLCTINLAVADGDALQVHAMEGKGAERMLGVEFPTDQGINAWIYRNGKPALIEDADLDPRRLHIKGRTEAIRAAVGAPLIADGQPIGTIYAASRRPGVFAESHLGFLTLTATQVAVAVQRAQLLEQARQRAEEMESISNIGAVMASSHDVDHVLRVIYEQSSRIMDTSAFFVALCDVEKGELAFPLFFDEGGFLEPFTGALSGEAGFAPYVVHTGKPLLVRHLDREQDKFPFQPIPVGQPTQSWIGVPIVFQDEVLGVISAQSYEPYAFTGHQLQLLSAIANQAGVGLQNARLFAGLQQAHQSVAEERDKLVHLHRLVANMQRADGIEAKLQVIADGIHELGWGRVSVSLRDDDLNVIELACAGFAAEDEAALRSAVLPGSEWQARFSGEMDRFRLGSCYYLPWSDPWVREHVQGVKSRREESAENLDPEDVWHPQDLLYIPLYSRKKQIIGIIGLDDPQDGRRPTVRSLQIIELFAQEAALAIENAKLVADLRLVNTDLQEMVDAQAHLLDTIEQMIPVRDSEEGLDRFQRLVGKEAGRAERSADSH